MNYRAIPRVREFHFEGGKEAAVKLLLFSHRSHDVSCHCFYCPYERDPDFL